MSGSTILFSLLCAASFAQLDSAPTLQRGRVVESTQTGVTIAVKSGQEPAVGTSFEVFIELPDLDGIAILAAGKVTAVGDGTVTATYDSKTGRVDKNHLVRFLPSKAQVKAAKPVPAVADLPTGAPDAPAPIGPVTGPKSGKPTNPDGPNPLPAGGASTGEFAPVIADATHALMVIGEPGKTHGTGFVISRDKRLVATTASVADTAKIAVLNEGRVSYKVIRRWYHPGVVRIMDDGHTRVQSTNPADGRVAPGCADLAILQLEPAGDDLPAQVTLASPADVQQLMGANVGVFGYSGSQFDQLVKEDLFASAKFIPGSVSRLSRLTQNPNAPADVQQLVYFNSGSTPGFGGSPVFQKDGRVIAIFDNHTRQNNQAKGTAYGVRVDALWELLDREGMAQVVAGDMAGFNRPESFDLPVDPQAAPLRQAIKLMEESAELLHSDEFEKSDALLQQAFNLQPTYWRLFWQASKNINHLVLDQWDELSAENKLAYAKRSLQHLQTSANHYKTQFGRINALLMFEVAREMINIGRLSNDVPSYNSALELLNDRTVQESAGPDIDYLLALRGSAKTDLNDLPGALEDLNEAIRLSPEQKNYYNSRSYVWSKLGQQAKAAEDKQIFKKMLAEEHHHEEEEKKEKEKN